MLERERPTVKSMGSRELWTVIKKEKVIQIDPKCNINPLNLSGQLINTFKEGKKNPKLEDIFICL